VKAAVHLLVLSSGILLMGCGVARTSYHVVTAPVRLFTGHSEKPSEASTTATTTTTTGSDVIAPGQPIASPTPTQTRRQVQDRVARASPSPASETKPKQMTEGKPKPGSSPSPSAAAYEFPTAKPVPGKPGYVFDPFDPNGGYIDVSGYPPGSKVKDPATKKIFIVP